MEFQKQELCEILNEFEEFTNKPESFISKKDNLYEGIKQFLKHTYDFTKTEEESQGKSDALPELIIHNFDEEQIFQQIELQNDALLNTCIPSISRLTVAKDRLIFKELDNDLATDEPSEVDNNDDNNENMQQESDNESDQSENIEEDEFSKDEDEGTDNETAGKTKKVKSSELDDKFFKLSEMNEFLSLQEKDKVQKKKSLKSDESESEDSDIDMFEASENEESENDIEGNDKLRNPRYKDFFRKKGDNIQMDDLNNIDDTEYMATVKSNLELREERLKKKNDEMDTEDTATIKSNLELREERLKKKIDEIEEVAVSDKPWQLKGEVTAENRPINSLLEEVLEFDLTTRPAPVITEETTYILEDVIRQRIKDKSFDDVERKQKPADTPLEFKKKLILDQEKSKESLAQIYEKEYVKQREALNTDQNDKEEEEPKLHQEIKAMMHSLFTKLDGLSNFHFTPKPIAPELRIISNLPAVSMEEVAPVASSDAALLAPQEVKPKINGDIIGKGERTKTDKKRERRKKKERQREHAYEKKKKDDTINKLRPGLGNKYSKEKVAKMLDQITKDANVNKMNHSYNKKIKSSSAFFTQLQENVTSQLKFPTKHTYTSKNKKHRDVKQLKL